MEFLDAYPKKAVDAFRKGLEYRKQKKNEDALKTFEMAIHVAPGFYQAHNQLGILYKEVGRNDDAKNETYIVENPRGEQLKDVIEMRDQLLKAKETGGHSILSAYGQESIHHPRKMHMLRSSAHGR